MLQLCREAWCEGSLYTRKPTANPKKGDLLVHERTTQHKNVLRRLGLPVPIQNEDKK